MVVGELRLKIVGGIFVEGERRLEIYGLFGMDWSKRKGMKLERVKVRKGESGKEKVIKRRCIWWLRVMKRKVD